MTLKKLNILCKKSNVSHYKNKYEIFKFHDIDYKAFPSKIKCHLTLDTDPTNLLSTDPH